MVLSASKILKIKILATIVISKISIFLENTETITKKIFLIKFSKINFYIQFMSSVKSTFFLNKKELHYLTQNKKITQSKNFYHKLEPVWLNIIYIIINKTQISC